MNRPPHEGFHRPIRRAMTDAEKKILDDFLPQRGVNDLRMELDAEGFQVFVFHGADGRIRGMSDRPEPRGEALDAVAVAHPYLNGRPGIEAGKEVPRIVDHELTAPVLPFAGTGHFSSQDMGHQLHPVTNP